MITTHLRPVGQAARKSGLFRIVTAVALGLSVLLGLILGTTPPASAATVTGGVNLRPCVSLNWQVCAPVGTTNGGNLYKVRCWRDGSWATGAYSSNRWFLVVLSDMREGFVHSSFVGQQPSVPNCSTLSYVRAADKALTYFNQVYAPTDVANRYTDWRPGPWAEWSGDCAKLSRSAWELGGGVSHPGGNAIDQYYNFRNRGMILGGIPRYGAPVYYNIARPAGHVALYIGGTTILTTQGVDNNRLPVVRRDLNSYGNYLGWSTLN